MRSYACTTGQHQCLFNFNFSLHSHIHRREVVSGPCPFALDHAETPGYGQMTSVRQKILTVTSSHDDLRRVAQIIAWLEDQSFRDLLRRSPGLLADSLNEFGTTAGFTRQEAIQNLRASMNLSEMSSQDPDAHTWYVTCSSCSPKDDHVSLSNYFSLTSSGSTRDFAGRLDLLLLIIDASQKTNNFCQLCTHCCEQGQSH